MIDDDTAKRMNEISFKKVNQLLRDLESGAGDWNALVAETYAAMVVLALMGQNVRLMVDDAIVAAAKLNNLAAESDEDDDNS